MLNKEGGAANNFIIILRYLLIINYLQTLTYLPISINLIQILRASCPTFETHLKA